jgi:F0F1-type ATP synthase epsilon subunit
MADGFVEVYKDAIKFIVGSGVKVEDIDFEEVKEANYVLY